MADSSRRDFIFTAGTALGAAAVAGIAGADADPKLVATSRFPGAVDADGKYALPPLPFEPAALEPHIDAATMSLHHDKHHAAYVKGLLEAEAKLAEMRATGAFDLVEHWEAKAAFHGAGHFLHCIFWESLSPKAGEPSGALRAAIDKDFGSVEAFKKQFSAAAKTAEGSGWAILAWSLAAKKLVVLQARNHQINSQWAAIPILVLDVWEHAYYLKYQNDRAKYVEAFWNVVAWEKVAMRYASLVG